jgi:vancomycin resistance protein YoaR
MSTLTASNKHNLSTLETILFAIFAGCITGIGILIVFAIGIQVWFAGRIMPGVSVAGVDVSGLAPQAAVSILNEKITYPSTGRIVLSDGDQTWLVTPGQMGLFLDPETSTEKALEIGRKGNLFSRLDTQWNSWRNGRNITPVFVFDERIAYAQLQQIATQINKPVIEADLTIQGTEVIVQPGQIGRTVLLNDTIKQIAALVPTMQDGVIDILVEETPPFILDPGEQAALAKQILSAPLTLVVENANGETTAGPWQFDAASLAPMLNIERIQDENGSQFRIGLESETLRAFLTSLAPELHIAAKDAAFTFNDETGQLDIMRNAIIGRSLDIEGTINAIQQKIVNDGTHQVPLVFEVNKPEINDDTTGADLGITELIHQETSYFYGSSRDRVQNISVAAAEFHGVLIPPNSTFSMAEVMDDITLDNGYAEALIIAGGRTIEGVGGGVCQVSTTLFRAAFFAGFPIVERHSHAYRVSYYEKTAGNIRDASLAGLDATVYIPIVDLKFTNDTDNWILMETYVNPTYSSIIWKFYSTSDGRTVEWTTTGPYNTVEPPEPKYIENEDLSEGTIKQVDWAAEGADVTVNRTVLRNGETLFSDTFFTHYRPWQAVYEYGPGTELPNSDSEE